MQGRLFSYPDTHRHRLGANYLQIPINCPYRVGKDGATNYQRDGPQCVTDNQSELLSPVATRLFSRCITSHAVFGIMKTYSDAVSRSAVLIAVAPSKCLNAFVETTVNAISVHFR